MTRYLEIIERLKQRYIMQEKGPLTSLLVRQRGKFGLGQVPAQQEPSATTTAVCGYCSTGCGLNLHLKDGEAVNLSASTHYPVNAGMACPKGWEALTPLSAPDRGTRPLIRKPDGERRAVSWDEALHTMCSKFKEIGREYGPESVAFISTGQIPTEEMALLGALTKFGMGMVHGDGNTRQCMASAVVAYKQSFGFDAPPYTYADFEESDVIVLVGSNLCIAHPIMWERVCKNPNDPRIVVVDPRKTETASAATDHFPIKPKSDLVFFYALARILMLEGWVDRDFIDEHTREFDAFTDFVKPYTPDMAEEATGIPAGEIYRLARMIHEGKRVSFWWTMGVNQSHEGVRVAQSIINLALMTGNIGKPGTGANSVTGQCNAMGSRLFSNTTNLLGGHDFGKEEDREKVAEVLDIEPWRIPEEGGRSYDQIIEGVLSGKIKALWVIATNPAHSWINRGYLEDILGRLDYLVVQDMYHSTETAEHADLFLPAAGWGEKEGTFINSERRFGLLKKVARAPGQALSDFYIFKAVAKAWGCAHLFEAWDCPESVFESLKELSKGQPCDFSGIPSYQALDALGGVQWPCLEGSLSAGPTERRLFEDRRFYHADGRAKFIFERPRDLPEPTDSTYPLALLTGRGSSSQWHTETRTGKSELLRKLSPREVYLEINPKDAKAYGIRAGSAVRVESRRGTVVAKAFITAVVQPGQIFMPMHYRETNALTLASFDSYSKQPSYKHCAVRVSPAPAWQEGAR